jgi:hypothetical protein
MDESSVIFPRRKDTGGTMTNTLIPRPSTAIVRGTEERLLLPARRAGYDLPIIGTSDEPDDDVYWQAPSGHWWLITDRQTDPTAEMYGGVVVPQAEREKLTELLREGFSPDRILVGHEFPTGWSPGDPTPDLVPKASTSLAPRPALAIERRDEIAATSTEVATTLGRATLSATKALVVGAAAVGAAIGQAFSGLDPIIIAGVRDPRTKAVTWVEVARWDW